MDLNEEEKKQLRCYCGIQTSDDEALKCRGIEGKREKESFGDQRQYIWQKMVVIAQVSEWEG